MTPSAVLYQMTNIHNVLSCMLEKVLVSAMLALPCADTCCFNSESCSISICAGHAPVAGGQQPVYQFNFATGKLSFDPAGMALISQHQVLREQDQLELEAHPQEHH